MNKDEPADIPPTPQNPPIAQPQQPEIGHGLVLQPLASADDLHGSQPAMDTAQTSAPQADATATEATGPIPVATPSNASQQAPQSQPSSYNPDLVTDEEIEAAKQYVAEHPLKKRRSKLVKALKITAGAAVIIVAIAAGGLYYDYTLVHVPKDGLATETSDGTVYLRPKNWVASTLGGNPGFATKTFLEDKPSAFVAVKKIPNALPVQFVNNPAYLNLFRTTLSSQVSESTFSNISVGGSGTCQPGMSIEKAVDTRSTADYKGLITISGTCVKNEGSIKFKEHIILGNDGNGRIIIVAAAKSNWDMNEDAYEKMIDSVAPVPSSK